MKNTWKRPNYLKIGTLFAAACAALSVAPNAFSQQRDPFMKPYVKPVVVAVPKVTTPVVVAPKPVKPLPPPIIPLNAPPVEARVEQYRVIKRLCAERGISCPKPTSVLMVEEIAVTGIFYTPRGYSAMVEATPIKLSYVIYPGEKFFNGQLVAIEENRLIFRKVTKLSNGKLVTVAENKPLRQEGNIIGTTVELASKNPDVPVQLASNDLPIMSLPVPVTEKVKTEPKSLTPAGKAGSPKSANGKAVEDETTPAAQPSLDETTPAAEQVPAKSVRNKGIKVEKPNKPKK